MQPSAASAPSPTSPSFAGLLAALADPEKKFPPARDLDGLADDVATLTYEHALRTYARYRPAPAPEGGFAAPAQEAAAQPLPAVPRESASHAPRPVTVAAPVMEERKNASVTVRLTREESERLRLRAAEAGITVSAYLRSCAFEVETLRTQVKQTLAEMRFGNQATAVLARRWFWPWKRRGEARPA